MLTIEVIGHFTFSLGPSMDAEFDFNEIQFDPTTSLQHINKNELNKINNIFQISQCHSIFHHNSINILNSIVIIIVQFYH